MVLICSSVTTNEIKHIFIWAFAIFVSSIKICGYGFGTG